MRAILRGSDENAIAAFNSSHRSIKDAIKRGTELEQALTDPRIRDLDRARRALAVACPFLSSEPDVGDGFAAKNADLKDLLERESFYREFPAIEQLVAEIETEYDRRYQEAIEARASEYIEALNRLAETPGWEDIGEGNEQIRQDEQDRIASSLRRGTATDEVGLPILQLRADRDALRISIAECNRGSTPDRRRRTPRYGESPRLLWCRYRNRRTASGGAQRDQRGDFAPDW